ncbi:MAG: TonB family protein, partial [Myxococcaceae bacterium]|nr:TonB family protein [Myxococcaceae bacterium]
MIPSSPRRRRQRRTPPALLGLVISLGLHGTVFGVLVLLALLGWLAPRNPVRPPTRDLQAVGLRTITAEQWAQNRGERPPEEDRTRDQKAPEPSEIVKAEPEEKKPEPEKIPDGQIVDVAPGNGEEDPNAKYLAESSNKTNKETKAKDQTAYYRNAMPRRTSTVPEKTAPGRGDHAEQAGNNGLGDDDRPLRDAQPEKLAMEVPDIERRDEVRLQKDDTPGMGPKVANRMESAQVHGNSNRLRIHDGDPMAKEDGSKGRSGAPGLLNLTPTLSVLDSVNGAAPNDHLEDVEEGDGTFLNTREWKYASFFNRVKQSIGMNWYPGRELRQRDPTGSIYGSRDRHTILQVVLDERGRIKDVYVAKSCGLDFLDLEAIHAFERAQPFPNPPGG